jgi:hypothetical protein
VLGVGPLQAPTLGCTGGSRAGQGSRQTGLLFETDEESVETTETVKVWPMPLFLTKEEVKFAGRGRVTEGAGQRAAGGVEGRDATEQFCV